MIDNETPIIDEHDLREIMERHGTPLLKLVYSYVKNWTTAEDIVQETFITFSQKYYQFKGKSSLKTWLYQIAINKSKDFLRSPKNKLLLLTLSKITLSNKGRDLDEGLIETDHSQLIGKCLFKIHLKYREVLNLFYYEDFSIKEISKVLSISESNVKARLSRGREKFKQVYLKEVNCHGRTIKEAKDIIG